MCLDRPCLEQILTDETRLAPMGCILRLLHLMLRQLGLVVVIEEGNVHLCSSGWSCDGSVNKNIIPSTRGSSFDPLAPHGPSGQAPATFCTHTPCSDPNPERELHEMCLVLTDDTKLAHPEQLEEVEGEIVEGRLVIVIPIDNT